jgi:hypothetical protein
MKFKDFIKIYSTNFCHEEYKTTHKINGVTMELHKNPRKSEFKLPIGWELKGWLDATTGDLWVFIPTGHWMDASDFEHENIFARTGLSNKNKLIPIYLNRSGVDVGEWSMTTAMNYTKGWEKIYQKYLDKYANTALDRVRQMAIEYVEANKNIWQFYGTPNVKVGTF